MAEGFYYCSNFSMKRNNMECALGTGSFDVIGFSLLSLLRIARRLLSGITFEGRILYFIINQKQPFLDNDLSFPKQRDNFFSIF